LGGLAGEGDPVPGRDLGGEPLGLGDGDPDGPGDAGGGWVADGEGDGGGGLGADGEGDAVGGGAPMSCEPTQRENRRTPVTAIAFARDIFSGY
jgi:hypothetical protein